MKTKFMFAMLAMLFLCSKGWAGTYYVRSDGSASTSLLAMGCSAAGSAMSPPIHDSETFAAGDTIKICDDGGNYKIPIVPPTSGTSGNVITYEPASGDSPLLGAYVDKNDASDWVDQTGNIWLSADETTTGSDDIVNGDFAADITSWTLSLGSGASGTATHEAADGDPYNGCYKFVCGVEGASTSKIQIRQDNISITAGKCYMMRFHAKASAAFTIPQISVIDTTDPWPTEYYGGAEINASVTTSWKTFTRYFVASATDATDRLLIQIGAAIGDGETLYLDTIGLWESTSADCLHTTDVCNLIFNSDATTIAGTRVWTSGAVDATGEWFYDADTSKVRLFATSNPASYYSDIKCALYMDIFDVAANDYIDIKNLTLKYGGNCGIQSSSGNSYINVSDSEIAWIGGRMYGSAPTSNRAGNGIQFLNSSANNTVTRCLIYECYDAGITNQGTTASTTMSDITYSYNIIYNCHCPFEIFSNGAGSSITNNNVYNNTLYNSGGGWEYNQRGTGFEARGIRLGKIIGSPSIKVKNNIFCGTQDWAVDAHTDTVDFTGIVFDNNVYDDVDSGFRWDGSTYASLALFQAGKSQDANSKESDPLFVDASGGDFELLHNSPCIGAGVDLGASHIMGLDPAHTIWITDIQTLDQRSSQWDIGAYIYPAACNKIMEYLKKGLL